MLVVKLLASYTLILSIPVSSDKHALKRSVVCVVLISRLSIFSLSQACKPSKSVSVAYQESFK